MYLSSDSVQTVIAKSLRHELPLLINSELLETMDLDYSEYYAHKKPQIYVLAQLMKPGRQIYSVVLPSNTIYNDSSEFYVHRCMIKKREEEL